jgi:hypothetical protein
MRIAISRRRWLTVYDHTVLSAHDEDHGKAGKHGH